MGVGKYLMDFTIEKTQSDYFVVKGISTRLYKDKLHDKTPLFHVLHCLNNKEYFIITCGMCSKIYKEKKPPK
jgi:hypothetical protein